MKKLSGTWTEYLDLVCHCYTDEVGNRPCDNGCPCDRCDYTSPSFTEWQSLVATEEVSKIEKVGADIEDLMASIVDFEERNGLQYALAKLSEVEYALLDEDLDVLQYTTEKDITKVLDKYYIELAESYESDVWGLEEMEGDLDESEY